MWSLGSVLGFWGREWGLGGGLYLRSLHHPESPAWIGSLQARHLSNLVVNRDFLGESSLPTCFAVNASFISLWPAAFILFASVPVTWHD